MLALASQIETAVAAIRRAWDATPRVGIILGTGLGGLAREIDAAAELPYAELPHFPASTALGHKGQLVCGTLVGQPVVAMEGRFHLYEGYSAAEATFPVRVMKALGIELLIVSNASGGLNPNYASGDIMVLDDHIDLMAGNPLTGVNDDNLGPRFPDMSSPYDAALVDRALELARLEDFVAHRGIYVAMTGPSYETRAEYRFLRTIGGDVVGMSTVPEVIVAAHAGLKVLALSTVTNMCLPDRLGETSGEAVIAASEGAAANLQKIVRGVLTDLAPQLA